MIRELRAAIYGSETARSKEVLAAMLQETKEDPWIIHETLYPVVQRVLNPPFINPHLSKMHAINREIAAYLSPADRALLLAVEVSEYSRREKLPFVDKPVRYPAVSSFADVEKYIAGKNREETTAALAVFLDEAGPSSLARYLLLLGSGYIADSLGHSVSCTAFILLEMIRRRDQDPWPTLALLADYFCKGGFAETPQLRNAGLSEDKAAYETQLRRAVSGTGIIALHDTITLYAIERCRHLLDTNEYAHMLAMWAAKMGDKEENLELGTGKTSRLPGYHHFFAEFSQKIPLQLLPYIKEGLSSEEGRRTLGRYIIRSVLESYDGRYNPHVLTGLGAALWVMQRFHELPLVVMNGWLQYLDYFSSEME